MQLCNYYSNVCRLASISRLSPSTCTNCSVTFDPPVKEGYGGSKVTLQFVRLEGESLEIEAMCRLGAVVGLWLTTAIEQQVVKIQCVLCRAVRWVGWKCVL